MERLLNNRIAEALKLTKKSNDFLANALGVNKNTISAYKNEKGELKGKVLEGLCLHFGFNPEWLLTGNGLPKNLDKKKEQPLNLRLLTEAIHTIEKALLDMNLIELSTKKKSQLIALI